MNCPHCNQHEPETGLNCSHCGGQLRMEGIARKPRHLNGSVILIALVVIGLAVMGFHGISQGSAHAASAKGEASASGHSSIINSETPGQKIDITNHIVAGKTTIFDFYSEFCGPCRRIAPYLKQLNEKRKDITVLKVDINRPGIRRIDWSSPVVSQYKIGSVPHFVIYDADGNKTHEGKDAYTQVFKLLRDSNISF